MEIPIKKYITRFFNVSPEEIETLYLVQSEDGFEAHIQLKKKEIDCLYCGGPTFSNGYKRKRILHGIFLDSCDVIVWQARRYRCRDCGRTFLEKNPFSFPGLTISYETARRIMMDLKCLHYTYRDIAQRNHVSPTTVQLYLDSWVNIPRQKLPECLGIDELHSSMAHTYHSAYLCTLVDNESRCLFEILPSRSKRCLADYFSQIPRMERKKVKYVTIDMWQPYKDIVLTYLPNAIIAVDPFHVIEHLYRAFQEIRMELQRQVLPNSDTYYLLKKWHWLLDKDHVDLDNEPQYNHRFRRKLNHRDLFNMLLDISDTYTLAYRIKEEYRTFNKEATAENASVWLDHIILEITASQIPQYHRFLQLLIHWKSEILHSFLRPYHQRKLSNAYCENVNGQIRSYLNISKGNTNFFRFRKRMLFALNDKIFYSLTQFLHSNKMQGKPRN